MRSFQHSVFSIQILAVLTAVCFTACEPNTPVGPDPEPQDSIPASFPKKQLIEEFTGQDCGYCPYGMDCIHEFIGNDTNFVLILHHYGYQKDNFSVSGSQTITSTLKVDGAPSMAINRSKTKYGTQSTTVFHPGYLENVSKAQFATETYASINISNTYDAASRALTVHVDGIIAKDDAPELQLTVLVKESGMVDYQQDYYYTFEGWQEFRHTNAVRAFLTAAKGDVIEVADHRYSAEYTVTLKSKWVPENCMVVAFLSEAFKPVVQAEQRPVVDGTQGGADLSHGGITAVPVTDYYPEPGEHTAPSDFSEMRSEPMKAAQAKYSTYTNYGFNYWQIAAVNSDEVISVGNTSSIRYATIHLFTEISQTTLPTGTYELNTSMSPGTAWAGYRDDANFEIGGSMFYFTNQSYYNQGYLVPTAQWLIADGELMITESGWSISGHARNGASINLVGSTPIVNKGKASAPIKLPQQAPQQFEYCTPQ